MAEYRKKLPADAYHVARLVTVQREDCGTCVQIEVNLARQDGLAPALLQSVLDGNFDQLPKELADVYRFAEATVSQQDDTELREKIRQYYGEEAWSKWHWR